MTWKAWIVTGLLLQVAAVLPTAILVLLSTSAKFSQEVGTVVQVSDRAGRREWSFILAGFALIAVGAICQIVGVLRSP